MRNINLFWLLTKRLVFSLIVISCSIAVNFTSQAQWKNPSDKWNTIGPPNGTLYIIGGSASLANIRQFIKLAGGPNAPIAVITTAGDVTDEKNSGYEILVKAGAKNLTIVHTKDKNIANSADFIKPLEKAKAVMITGGFQKRLAEAYLYTRTHKALFELLARGGVVAGSSAGASIQGSLLYGGQGEKIGFSFMRKSAIGQHYVRRNRMGSVARMIKDTAEYIGFGIDEATAIIVRGNEVIGDGESKTAIYDPARIDFGKANTQEYLFEGDKFNLVTKKITYRAKTYPTDLWQNASKPFTLPTNKWKSNVSPNGKIVVYGAKKLSDEELKHFYHNVNSAAIVLLSSGNENHKIYSEELASKLKKLGAKNVKILHTINSDEANSVSFAKPLTNATAVLLAGGEKWQFSNNYRNTLVHRELYALLERSGSISSSFYTAPVLTSRLFGEAFWTRGLSLINNSLLFQEKLSSRHQKSLTEFLTANAKLKAIGLSKQNILTFEKGSLAIAGTGEVKILNGPKEAKVIASGTNEAF
jgi:cyanophycinase